MNAHSFAPNLATILLLAGLVMPLHAQRLTPEGGLDLGEGPEDIIARQQWYSAQRLQSGTLPTPQQRIKAWEQATSAPVHHPDVMLKSGLVASQQWKCVGPRNRGGRLTGIAIHPWDEDIVYMTAANGGIWKTIDGGNTMTPIADNLPTLAMGAIAVDPSDPNIVWAGSGEANIWKYAYPGVGVFKSTDEGSTWVLTGLPGNTRVAAIRVHPMKGYIVLAATIDGLFRTTDGGTTWETVLHGETYDLATHSFGNVWFAGVRGKGIYKSNDEGATWEWISETWADSLGIDPAKIRRIALDVCKKHPNVVYAILVDINTSGVYAIIRSVDSGETWGILQKPSFNVFASQGFYNCDLAVNPVNPERVLIGGILIYQTLDGGQTWTYRSPSHVDQHALEFAPSNPDIFYAGHDGGFNRSTDGGSSYDGQTHIIPITQYYDIDVSYQNPNIILGGTQDNGSHLGSTLSQDWKRVTGSDGGVCIIDYENPRFMYTEIQTGKSRYRSDDSGATWKGITAGIEGTGAWVTPVILHPQNPAILYTATTSHLYMTTNRGDAWFKLSEGIVSGHYIQHLAIAPTNPSNLAAGYNGSGGLALSDDGGTTWTRRALGVFSGEVSDIEYYPADPLRIFVTCGGWSGQHVFRSTDGGLNWASITGNLPVGPVNTLALNPANSAMLWVGTDFGVFVTTNEGDTWEILGEGMPLVSVLDLVYHAPSGRLFAATHGRGVWELVAATPVDVASFRVDYQNAAAVLKWNISQTATVGFAVERKEVSTESWTEIGYVPANGCAAVVCPYTYSDLNLPSGADAVVYRIRLLNSDGTHKYSHELFLSLGAAVAGTPQLHQNYPNPFNPLTIIRYAIPEAGMVRLEVTNARGIRVAVLADTYQSAGSHTMYFDASGLPSGVYFYHLITNGKKLTRKMVLLK